MASIDKNKLISKLGYVAYFNEKVWGQINSTAGGNIYHAGADITLNKDKIIKRLMITGAWSNFMLKALCIRLMLKL